MFVRRVDIAVVLLKITGDLPFEIQSRLISTPRKVKFINENLLTANYGRESDNLILFDIFCSVNRYCFCLAIVLTV